MKRTPIHDQPPRGIAFHGSISAPLALCIFGASILLPEAALAVNVVHQLTPAAGNWSTGTWTNGVPGNNPGDVAQINTAASSATTALDTPVTIGNLQIGASATTSSWTINTSGGNTLTLDGTGINGTNQAFGNIGVASIAARANNTASVLTINPDILMANTNLDIGSTNNSHVTINGNITASSALSLNFRGSGNGDVTIAGSIGASGSNIAISNLRASGDNVFITGNLGTSVSSVTQSTTPTRMTLSGTNTFTGGVSLSSGTLALGSATALGAAASSLTITGGNLDSSVANLTISNNNAQNWNGNFEFVGTQSLNIGTGPVTLSANRQVTVTANTLTVGGNIGGAFTLTKLGAGTLELTGMSSYSDNTLVNNGTVTFNSIANVGGGNSALGAPTTAANGEIALANGTTLRYTGPGHSTDRVIDVGSGTATLESAGSGSLIFDAGSTSTSIIIGANIRLSGAGDGEVKSRIASGSSNGVTKDGTGTWRLTGSSTYGGLTQIEGGTLEYDSIGNVLGGATALGNPGNGTNGILQFSNNGILKYIGTGHSSSRGIQLNVGGGTLDASGTGLLTLSGNVNGNTRPLTLSGSANGTLSGAIATTTGTLTKSGVGTWILSNANTYTGATLVNNGLLRLDHATALPGGIANVNGAGSNLNFNGGVIGLANGNFLRALGTGSGSVSTAAQVQWTGDGGFAAHGAARNVNLGNALATVTWGSGSFVPAGNVLILGSAAVDNTVTFQNPIDFGGAARTVRADNGTAAIDGILSGALTNGGLTKTGLGTLQLTNTSGNTYTGTTLISAGTLALAAASANNLANSATINVATSATLDVMGLTGNSLTLGLSSAQTLKGTGTVYGGLVVAAANGTVAPGNSIGMLSVTGPATLNGAYLLETDLLGNADVLAVGGLLTLNGTSILDLDGTPFSPTMTYIIASYGSIAGTFGTVDPVISATHTVNYAYLGNQIALVPIPEPNSLLLLLLGAVALSSFSRRRRS